MIAFVIFWLLAAANGWADPVYPSGQEIRCDYVLDGLDMQLGDTLTINRTIVSDEPLTGLYISERVPAGFRLIDWSINADAEFIDSGPLYWLVGDSADSLTLSYRFTVPGPGIFVLPLHTSVWRTGFSTGPEITISILSDTIPPAPVKDLGYDEH